MSIKTNDISNDQSSSLKTGNENGPKLKWTDQTEDILVKWSDNAVCYKWLHDKSFRKYRFLNYLFTIPVIILSTITGTLSVGIDSLVPASMVQNAQIIIGATNIIAGIITTLLNFFRYAQLSESHSNSAMGWAKLQRIISVELALERKSRKDADTFIKMCRNDYERLIEQAPVIPSEVLNYFKKKYSNVSDLVLPEACAKIIHTKVYKSPCDPEEINIYTDEEMEILNEAKNIILIEKQKLEKMMERQSDVVVNFKPEPVRKSLVNVISDTPKPIIKYDIEMGIINRKPEVIDKEFTVKDLISKFQKNPPFKPVINVNDQKPNIEPNIDEQNIYPNNEIVGSDNDLVLSENIKNESVSI